MNNQSSSGAIGGRRSNETDAKTAGLILILLVSFADAFTTSLGLAAIFNPSTENPASFLYVIVPAAGILAILLFTEALWRVGGPFGILKYIWVGAFAYDVWTSFMAGLKLLTVGVSSVGKSVAIGPLLEALPPAQLITLIFGTVIVSGCPVLFSYVIKD